MSHTLRDQAETVLRAWNAHETARGNPGIIDYDCHPTAEPVPAAPDRLWVLTQLTDLYQQATDENNSAVATRLRADLAYLRAVLGEHPPLDQYILDTQGCLATGWTDDDLDRSRQRAQDSLTQLGITWGPNLDTDLRQLEGPLTPAETPEAITAAAKELEPAVRALTGTQAPYDLTVETTDLDAYWAFWLDGTGPNARLRLNLRHARYTQVRARQFALHEVLGHALQCASYAHHATTRDVPWIRIMSVHTPYQVLLEGLAQALPLFATPDDPALTARVRLAHYTQLVSARAHLAINAGTPAQDCAATLRPLAPWWTDNDLADDLADRGANPLLRSYLWSYPAGIDWFTNLADTATQTTISAVLQAAYQNPLTPTELATLLGNAGQEPS